jgi:hypothetical protein
MRYRLRTLLLVMLVAGVSPWAVLRYLDWQRDRALARWRATFSASFETGEARDRAEQQAVQKYFAARERSIYAWSLVGVDRRNTAKR